MLVLEALAFVLAEVEAGVAAVTVRPGAGISGLALAGVAVRLLDEEAVGVAIAEGHLTFTNATPRIKKNFKIFNFS